MFKLALGIWLIMLGMVIGIAWAESNHAGHQKAFNNALLAQTHKSHCTGEITYPVMVHNKEKH